MTRLDIFLSILRRNGFFKYIPITLLFCLAFFLRMYALEQLRMTHDEMSLGYNAFSIVKTSKDEWGVAWPLVFKAFGDWKLPGYVYVTAPFISALGLNPVSVRLPSILAGVVSVLAMWLLTFSVTERRSTAWLAASLMAVAPWSIHVSRLALESNLALTFYLLGLVILVQSQINKRVIYVVFASFFWAAAMYTYIGFRLLVPLSVVIVGFWWWRSSYRSVKILLLGLIILVVPLYAQLFADSGMARFSQVGLFADVGIEAAVIDRRNYCFLVDQSLLPRMCQLLFNKPLELSIRFVEAYVEMISIDYLFVAGDPREYLSVPGYGLLPLVLAPFYLVGVISWWKQGSVESKMVGFLAIIAPLATALTGEANAIRGSLVLPFVVIFIAYGIGVIMKLIPSGLYRWFFIATLTLILSIQLIRFSLSYYFLYPNEYRMSLYQMDARIAEYIWKNKDSYDKVIISSDFPDAHILFAFITQYDPETYQNTVLRYPADSKGFEHVQQLENIHFGQRLGKGVICSDSKENILYVTSPAEGLLSTKQFFGFSQVHGEVDIVDVQILRDQLQQEEKLEKYCPQSV